MSETDDTDDLLLIPPDFFLTNVELEPKHSLGPFYGIIDNLVTEVYDLQDRISNIETVSDISLVGSSFDLSDSGHKMQDFRKYNSIDDLYFSHSSQSTPHKTPSKYKLNSLPASPNINRFSPKRPNSRKSPRKKSYESEANIAIDAQAGGEMLSEIDKFLSKVKTIQRINAARNLEREFDDKKGLDPGNREIREIESMVRDIDLQKQHLENQIKSRENDLAINEPICVKEKTWKCGDNEHDVNSMKSSITDQSKAPLRSKSPDSSSSESTQATAFFNFKPKDDLLNAQLHSNAMNILNLHKQLEDSIEETINCKKDVNALQSKTGLTQNHLELISLADIWDKGKQDIGATLKHKLHEERLRRQHCEVLISELHQRNLELQQKIVVAIKVDQAKDNAISQLKELVEKMTNKLDVSNKEKIELEKEIQNIKTSNITQLEDARRKSDYYEREAAKALNLAHAHHEKFSNLESKCNDLTGVLTSLENTVETLREDYAKETYKNKQLCDCLSLKEIELLEHKNLLNNAKQEVSESKTTVDECQIKLDELKRECDRLENQLKNERNQLNNTQEHQKILLDQLDKKGKQEKQLKEELNKFKEKLDTTKIELRNFYQGQVELLVQSKLKEFQGQLDKAEQTFREELKKKEMQIAKNAAIHMQQLTEKCTLEIKLLEEKHQEEIKLYHIQIIQHKEEVQNLKSKVEAGNMKRNHQVQQLQRIMESQWNEALKIISNGKSPTPLDQFDQLNSLKTKSYNNLEEVLSEDNLFFDDTPSKPGKSNEASKGKDNATSNELQETPVSSRRNQCDGELHKLMNMLVNNNPPETKKNDKSNPIQQSLDKSSWPHLVRNRKPK